MVKIQVTEQRLKEMKEIDPESSFYVDKFMGRKGQVFDVTTTSGGFENYHVNFGKEIGIFYRDEVTIAD
jgi:hypothetical protein